MIHTADKVHFHKFIHSNILLSNTKISFQNILTRSRCNAMPEFKVFSGNAKGFFLSVFVTVSANWPWQADQRLHLTNGKQTTNIFLIPTNNFVSCSWIELHHDLSKTLSVKNYRVLVVSLLPAGSKRLN